MNVWLLFREYERQHSHFFHSWLMCEFRIALLLIQTGLCTTCLYTNYTTCVALVIDLTGLNTMVDVSILTQNLRLARIEQVANDLTGET